MPSGMVRIGYALSAEEHSPSDLVRNAARAEEAGFEFALISDHYHPWVDAQGHSAFVWSVLGGIARETRRLEVGTGVTCPMIRIHPAVIAHAAATTAELFEGRFFLGVGTGENLNEHILGDRWPSPAERLEMLAEAVEVIRLLWSGGTHSFRGRHYRVESARLYDLPEQPPPIYMSAFGPAALRLAAEIADGYVGTSPDPELVEKYREHAGPGTPCLGGAKACWHPDEGEARKRVHQLWPNLGLPGQLAQELQDVAHFEDAVQLVDESVADSIALGPDPERHAAAMREYGQAGYDIVYVHQIGPDQEGFFDFYRREVIPRL
jgi:G6PDH family F420-dependent oxidoreductase